MPFGRALLNGGQMVLPVFAVYALVTACRVELAYSSAVEEEFTALQIAFLASQLIESYQCHLHYGMTWRHLNAVLVKDTQHVVGSLLGAVQQFILSCSQIVGDTGLNEFAHVESLVRQVPVTRPLLSVIPGMEWVMDSEVGL